MDKIKPLDAMKLLELKTRARDTWNTLNSWKGDGVLQPENFKCEVASFGDRRRRDTWIKALCRFRAMLAYKSCLDSWALLTITFNFRPDRWDYEYRHQILDEFLMYPDALEIIKGGLEDLYSKDFSNQEREEANGFFELVAEREGRTRRFGNADGFAGAIPGVSAAA
ncbi:MAG: hypothetical protein AAF050_14220 [Cyanobacteria bacterium J06649_5]